MKEREHSVALTRALSQRWRRRVSRRRRARPRAWTPCGWRRAGSRGAATRSACRSAPKTYTGTQDKTKAKVGQPSCHLYKRTHRGLLTKLVPPSLEAADSFPPCSLVARPFLRPSLTPFVPRSPACVRCRNPYDESFWYLKCRALTAIDWLDDLEVDDDTLADQMLDENAIAQMPRPGTSMNRPATGTAGPNVSEGETKPTQQEGLGRCSETHAD